MRWAAPSASPRSRPSVKANLKQWEPEQSDVPGGEPRFANEASVEVVQDRSRRASRTDWVKNFAYPAPRTFTYSEIVTPQAGYVLGVDSNGRNAQSMKMSPPAHSMSGHRLATTQRESRRASQTRSSRRCRRARTRCSRPPTSADIPRSPSMASSSRSIR